MGDNERALKSYQKAGFKVEGKLRQDMFIDSQYKDVVIMGRLAGESQ
jgi:RimJ/RimL family protein N-acetyltransferase